MTVKALGPQENSAFWGLLTAEKATRINAPMPFPAVRIEESRTPDGILVGDVSPAQV